MNKDDENRVQVNRAFDIIRETIDENDIPVPYGILAMVEIISETYEQSGKSFDNFINDWIELGMAQRNIFEENDE